MKKKRKRLSLKTTYYMAFYLLIVIPLLLVLFITLLILNQQFRKQAIENIERAQENIVTEIVSDINVMSMRLSHLLHTNDNEIIRYAADTDTEDGTERYENEKKLFQAGNLALEPVKDIVSVGFYMKNGRTTYIKNPINRTFEEIREKKWYQKALEHPNSVCVGSYDTTALNDLYKGGRKDLFVLVFALSPDMMMDRSGKIEMVTFYQTTGTGDTIKEYNQEYLKRRNKLGIMQVVGTDGEVIFSTVESSDFTGSEYTCVRTPISLGEDTWYVENYIKTRELTQDFWQVAYMILGIAVLIFIMAGYYSRYFLKMIIKPIEEISSGLRQVEEGNLNVHITAKGQIEVRTMIHQFNAMVRKIGALIDEYEQKVKGVEKSPSDYFTELMEEKITPAELAKHTDSFFAEEYSLIGLSIDGYSDGRNDMDAAKRLAGSFEHNFRFASRCLLYIENPHFFFIFYQITEEEEYSSRIAQMAKELQNMAKREFGVELSFCIDEKRKGYEEFADGVCTIRKKNCLRFLLGEQAIINLAEGKEEINRILSLSKKYERLADALYIADEKNMVEERDKLFEILEKDLFEDARENIFASILAIANRFETDCSRFSELFDKKYNYIEKLDRLEDKRGIKIWLTNYFAWIMDYSATKLHGMETDAIIKAKRYIADNFDDAELSLLKVAEYVELNEKYFTNRFTKETGETFSSYLTTLRMQKARELLKTTNFKIYEIAEMVGYHSVEHFNRMFKKMNGISPLQYRKTM